MKLILATVAALVFCAPALAQEGAGQPVPVEMKGADGASNGMITLTPTPHGVLLDADLTGMADGEYAFHFHEAGVCEGNFDSAKGHHNPTGKEHGFLAANGPHPGDMANVYVVDGKARFQQFNPMVAMTGGDAPLNDADGTALMVHGGMDDYASQPSGDAGSRMACGVVFPAG